MGLFRGYLSLKTLAGPISTFSLISRNSPTGLSGAPRSLRPRCAGLLRTPPIPWQRYRSFSSVVPRTTRSAGLQPVALYRARDMRGLLCRLRGICHCSRSRNQHARKASRTPILLRRPRFSHKQKTARAKTRAQAPSPCRRPSFQPYPAIHA
jgi:hypothetical protein